MSQIFAFGERREGFPVPVLNERAVRAAAGLLFLPAMVAFMNAWLLGDFQPTRVFVVAFLIDFALRLFVNPKFAPSLIVGQWLVRAQQPEWVGAPQKRFAWGIGLVMALAMGYLVVIERMVGPVNLMICLLCLLLMFFETAFGICIGCKVYNALHDPKAQHCPGGVCELTPEPGAGCSPLQGAVVIAFLTLVTAWAMHAGQRTPADAPDGQHAAAPVVDTVEAERCKVPDFAKAMGHEEKWKLHNNCR